MKTTAWAWLTAGVLALGVNGFYQDGGAAWLHRAVGQIRAGVSQGSSLLADLATGQFDRFLMQANLLQARAQTATSCRGSVAVARMRERIARTQDRVARFDAMSARRQGALAQMESSRAEMEAKLAGMQFASYESDESEGSSSSCRRVVVHVPEVHVSVPGVDVRVPQVHAHVPEVHVSIPQMHINVPQISVHQPAVDVRVPSVHVDVPQVAAPI